ncbi:hypothetical protein GCM10020295_73240 [Streptomyces cinereospinus]
MLRLPLMDCTRAHTELGWRPTRTAPEVIEEFLHGMQQGAGGADGADAGPEGGLSALPRPGRMSAGGPSVG